MRTPSAPAVRFLHLSWECRTSPRQLLSVARWELRYVIAGRQRNPAHAPQMAGRRHVRRRPVYDGNIGRGREWPGDSV